jgi:pimeloyl-ACP methyl ester carboxylesterase
MNLSVDGRGVYAYTGGRPFDAAGRTIVFLHGAVTDHSVWTLLARWFAHHGFGVLAVDLPGHMRSDGPPLRNVEALADWTIALLDAAGVGRAALVGHSMGSLIALEAAARVGRDPTRLGRGLDGWAGCPLRRDDLDPTRRRARRLRRTLDPDAYRGVRSDHGSG